MQRFFADSTEAIMRVLVITEEMPFPPVGGGLLRTYHWLQALSRKHEVTLVAFTFGDAVCEPPPFPVKIIGVAWEQPPLYRDMESEDRAVAERAFANLRDDVPEPWYASYFQSAPAMEAIRKAGREADLVLIEESNMGQFISALPKDVMKILDLHNVYTLIAERASRRKSGAEGETAQRETRRTARFETNVAGECILCLACSEEESAAARNLLGAPRVAPLPNGVDTSYFTPAAHPPQSANLLFTGSMNYPPNIEAVEHFVTRILPLVQLNRPYVVFHIVGTKPDERVKRLQSKNVIVHGRVPDIRPYFADAELFVAPILSGGGTRLKILEAAASGKAIVTSSLGPEGLALSPGRDLIVADTPTLFAKSVIDLMENRGRISELGRNARHASLPYDWGILEERLLHLIDEATQNHRNALT
jgi:glycosyltransferase involved in cell wall biosynthesis